MRGVWIQEIAIADDDYAFGQSGYLFNSTLDSLDDDGAGCASENLSFGEAMNMRVVPIQSRWLIGGNANTILKWRVVRLD